MFIRTNVKPNITVVIRDSVQASGEQQLGHRDHFAWENAFNGIMAWHWLQVTWLHRHEHYHKLV